MIIIYRLRLRSQITTTLPPKPLSPPPLQHVKMQQPLPQPGMVNKEGGAGLETPTRWVFFTSTITIFLLTNDLLDASPCYCLSPLIGGLSLDLTGHNWHQRVIMTYWCLFLLLLRPHRPHQAPTSPYDSLVAFPTSLLTTPATTSTNES